MKILALILVLLLGAGAVFLLWTGGTAVERVEPASRGTSDELLRDVRDQLATLGDELGRLRSGQEELAMRLDLLENRPSPVAVRTPVSADSPEELAELREIVAAMKDPARADAPGLETFVLDVLDEKEQQEELERQRRREEARQERLVQRVDELTRELGLSAYQSQEMLTVLSDESARRDAVIATMRETGDWDRRAMRDAMGAIRDETRETLSTVLTPEQLDRYGELDRGGGPGRGGERGDPGGGGRGGADQGGDRRGGGR